MGRVGHVVLVVALMALGCGGAQMPASTVRYEPLDDDGGRAARDEQTAQQWARAAEVPFRDKAKALIALRSAQLSLAELSDELRADREVALLAARLAISDAGASTRFTMALAPDKVRADKELQLAANASGAEGWAYAPALLQDDFSTMFDAVRIQPGAFVYASPRLQADARLVELLRPTRGDGLAIHSSDIGLVRYARLPTNDDGFSCRPTKASKSDDYILLKLSVDIDSGRCEIPFGHDANQSFVQKIVSANGDLFDVANAPLRENKQLQRLALRASVSPLIFGGDGVRADRESLRLAVKRDFRALSYASDALRAERSVVEDAVRAHPSAIIYASESLRADASLAALALRHDPANVRYLSPSLRADRGMMLDVVKRNAAMLAWVAPSLRADEGFVTELVAANESLYEALPAPLRANSRIARAAVLKKAAWIALAPQAVRADKSVMAEVVTNWGGGLRYASPGLRKDCETVLRAVASDPAALRFADSALLRHAPFMDRIDKLFVGLSAGVPGHVAVTALDCPSM